MRAGGLIEIIYRNNCVYKQGGSPTNEKGGFGHDYNLSFLLVSDNDTDRVSPRVNSVLINYIENSQL